MEYSFEKVREFEQARPELKIIIKVGLRINTYKILRAVVYFSMLGSSFSNSEECDAKRFISIALSQGGLQSILKAGISEFEPYLRRFEESVNSILGNDKFAIDFCYRMRIGVK